MTLSAARSPTRQMTLQFSPRDGGGWEAGLAVLFRSSSDVQAGPSVLDLSSGNRWFANLIERVDAHMRPADQAWQPVATIEEIEDHHL